MTKFSHILGSVSCVQVFNRALNPAEINLKKYCPDANRASLVVPCPNGYEIIEGQCLKVMSNRECKASEQLREVILKIY